MKKKIFNIFYILDCISNTKEDVTEHPLFEKEYNIYMINRWLSMSASGVIPAYFADQIRDMSKKQHFYFVRQLFGKSQETYFKYAKQNKTNKDIKIIMKYYGVSEENANEYLSILDKNQIKKIKSSFGGRK